MKNKGAVTVVAAMMLLLTGCAGTTGAEPAPTVTVTTEAEAPVAPAEPLVASTPTPEASGDDAAYLAEVRLRLLNLPDATDEQLLAAGEQSCALYAQGQAKTEQRLIEGEQPDEAGQYWDSGVIATWAAKTYCVEFDN